MRRRPDLTPEPLLPDVAHAAHADPPSNVVPIRPRAAPADPADPDPLEHFAPIELAVFEVNGFPAALLPDLPAPWLILAETLPAVHGAASPIRFAFASSADGYRSARALGLPTFNALEWSAIVLAAELDRVSFPTTARWLTRKAAEPGLLFTPERCTGIHPAQSDRLHNLTVAHVFAALGGRVVKAEVTS